MNSAEKFQRAARCWFLVTAFVGLLSLASTFVAASVTHERLWVVPGCMSGVLVAGSLAFAWRAHRDLQEASRG